MGKKEELIKEAKRLELIQEAQALEAAQNSGGDGLDLGQRAAQSLRSGLEGVTMGLSEPVISGMMAVQQHVKGAVQNADGLSDLGSRLVDTENLGKEYDADVARRKDFEAQNPTLAMQSEITGAMAPMLFTGGTSAAAKLLTAGPEALNAVGQSVTSLVKQFPVLRGLAESQGLLGSATRVAAQAAGGATQAVGSQVIKDMAQVPTGFEDPKSLGDYGETALMGAKFSGGLSAIPEVVGQGVRAAKGAARVFGGVKAEAIEKYMANPERIRNAASVEEIKSEVDATVQKLRDDFDNAKITKEEAKIAMKEAQGRVDDLVRENKNILATQKSDLKMAYKEAASDLEISFKNKKNEIKNAKMPVQPDDVLDSVENVKEQVTDLSKESYKILGEHKGKFKLGGITQGIGGLQKGLRVNGQLLSKDAEVADNVLSNWKEKLTAIGANNKEGLPAAQVKRVIQEIDSDLRKYSDKMSGEFSDKVYNELLSMRRLLDVKLKDQVPGYREVMEETAKLNQLRGDFVKLFGSRERVTSKLARLDNPNLQFEREKLRELGNATGKGWSTQIDDFLGIKTEGRNLDAVKQGLPENQAYVTALADYSRTQRPGFGQSLIDQAENASPEAQALRTTQGAVVNATDEAMRAKQALEPFKSITPQNSENQIRTLMGDRSRKIELKKLMGALGQVSDEDFVVMIDDLRVKEAFEKGNAQGSSNVNLWGAISGAIGFALGDPTLGLSSAGAGAAFGKIMDSYGPKMTKKVLDGVIYMKGVPTVQKIEQVFADLPDPLRAQLKSDLIRSVTIGNSTQAVSIPPDQRADLIKDVKDSQNLDSIEKADAISAINKKGAVSSGVMQKVMIGEEKAPDEWVAPMQQSEQQPAPRIDQLTDFIKTRKQEQY